MALTYTPETDPDFICPDFQLPGVDGQMYGRDDFAASPVLVVMFICNHCPYVKAIEDRLIALARDLKPKNVAFLAICSNDPTDYPEDLPAALRARWLEKNYGFPYLIDETQTVAQSFGAVCTPDLFVFNETRRLVYRGRLDDSWKDPAKVQNQELRAAIEATLNHRPLTLPAVPSMGCSIKWRQEQELL